MTGQTTSALRPALHASMDAHAENAHQARLIFNPTPEEDSLIEHVVALLRPDCDPGATVERMTKLLSRLAQSNSREGVLGRQVTGVLDAAVTTLHASGARSGITVKEAARRLRPHLRVAERASTEVVPAGEFFLAACAIKDVIGGMRDEVLRGNGLRNELGVDRHDTLLALLPVSA